MDLRHFRLTPESLYAVARSRLTVVMDQIHGVSRVDAVETVAIVCPHSNTTKIARRVLELIIATII